MKIVKCWKSKPDLTDDQIQEFADLLKELSIEVSSVSALPLVAQLDDGQIVFIDGDQKPVEDEGLSRVIGKLQEICEPVFMEQVRSALPEIEMTALATTLADSAPPPFWDNRPSRQEKKRHQRHQREQAQWRHGGKVRRR